MIDHPKDPDVPAYSARSGESKALRYAAWFHELDAWTEYWDVYHPETCGRFYFGDGKSEVGLLTRFLPHRSYPPAWVAWTRMALMTEPVTCFKSEVFKPDVRSAIMEVDSLVGSLFKRHFGEPEDPEVRANYLEAIFRFAIDTLPPATERDQRIPEGDWRKPTAGRHTLDGDLMWFAWSLQLEAAQLIAAENDPGNSRRALQIAGVATGCPANFAWRGHRRTRSEYTRSDLTAQILHQRGMLWAEDFDAGAAEVHALFRIREWGED